MHTKPAVEELQTSGSTLENLLAEIEASDKAAIRSAFERPLTPRQWEYAQEIAETILGGRHEQ